MTLQSSGQIKFSEIAAEFGYPTSNRFGNYRVSENIGSLTNLPLDTGVPQSGQIKFSNFHGKEANIIVDCHSFGSTNYNQDAYRNRFANGNFDVVGGFRTSVPKSAWQGGKTVIININKQFSSSGASSRNHFALEVGRYNNNNSQHGWPTSTELSVVVGSQGSVVGKGGDGGRGGYGGNESLVPGDGEPGSSGLKKHSGMSITGETRIRGGGGGGGGGLGVSSLEESDDEPPVRTFGGGGGGGAGIPNGEGGISGNNVGNLVSVNLINGLHPDSRHGAAGDDSNNTVGGSGGLGARIVTDVDESGDTQPGALCTMGGGGNGGSVQNNGNGSNGGDGSDNITGPHWVDDTPTGFGEGGLGGYRYITY